MKKLKEWYLTFLIYLYFKIEIEISRTIDKLTAKKPHENNDYEDTRGNLFDFIFRNIEKIKTEDELKRK